MNMSNIGRRITIISGAALLSLGVAGAAIAQQAFPSGPVTIIVPYPPGGTTDIYSRLVGAALQERLGTPFIIQNMPGGSTQIAADYVSRSEPDGHTLLMATITTMSMNPLTFQNLTYDPDDLIPVGLIARQSYALVVTPDFPANSVEELIAYAQENPGEINYASLGVGSSTHLVTELFRTVTGIDIEPVHYAGSAAALTAVMSGESQMNFDGITTALTRMADGQLRGLAMTGSEPVEIAPDLPVIADTYPDMVAYTWYGLVAARGTPDDVVEFLNAEINAVIAQDDLQERFFNDAVTPSTMNAAEFGEMIAADTEQWRPIVEMLDISLD